MRGVLLDSHHAPSRLALEDLASTNAPFQALCQVEHKDAAEHQFLQYPTASSNERAPSEAKRRKINTPMPAFAGLPWQEQAEHQKHPRCFNRCCYCNDAEAGGSCAATASSVADATWHVDADWRKQPVRSWRRERSKRAATNTCECKRRLKCNMQGPRKLDTTTHR